MITTLIEYWCADRNVGEMRAAIIRGVEHIHIAWMNVAFIHADDGFNRTVHGAQMNRHMRCVGDEAAFVIEDGT